MILILGKADDEHVRRVQAHIHQPVHVLDCADVPVRSRIEADIDSASLVVDGRRIEFADVTAVWRRRHTGYGLHPALRDDAAREFAWSETHEATQGALLAMDCAWFNHPAADDRAQLKIVQLRTARQLGLEVPATLVTSDPVAARSFVETTPGPVIRKAFRNLECANAHTRVVTADDLAVIDTVRYAPVIFQEYVPAALDLRITMVDGEVFAAAIKSDPAYHADYRPGLPSASVTAHVLRDQVADRLRSLCTALGLRYGAIDLRLTPEGQHVFLEVNPAGEFLFISERTGQPVAQAIADALDR